MPRPRTGRFVIDDSPVGSPGPPRIRSGSNGALPSPVAYAHQDHLVERSDDEDDRSPHRAEDMARKMLMRSASLIAANGKGGLGGSSNYLTINDTTGSMQRRQSLFHVRGLVDDRGHSFESYRKDEDELKAIKNKKIRKFYEHQNELLDMFAEVDRIIDGVALPDADVEASPLLTRRAPADEQDLTPIVIRAIVVNLIVNVVLLAGKTIVALVSGSVSLLASLVDSAMDLASTLIIGAASKFISYRSANSDWQWPRRMEPMSIVVFSTVMIASFVQVFIESIQRLASNDLETVELSPAAIGIMATTVVVKLVMWLWCRSFQNSSVRALGQDAENDVVFNFFSIVFPFIGQLIRFKYLDAIGGALLSVYIIYEWAETLFENVSNLSGARASPAEHQRIAYLLSRFSPLIKGVQFLNVYTQGDRVIVETDIILPHDTPLPVAHDVGESVQLACECLSGVERAHVHVDVSTVSPSSHMNK